MTPAEHAQLADALLAIPGITIPATWNIVLDLLPPPAATMVDRNGPPRLQGMSLLSVLRDQPDGLQELVVVLRVVFGDASAGVGEFAQLAGKPASI
ncbi:hypothetical protein AB0J72_45425 [Dactylosporangium sp. NPDC049742]|uniref:effector-associated domain 2-containing protein n=1 Tax=Dactylosporangium sp. NPDC049742 TaxID=3154737 RepID=UPI00343E0FFB